MNNTAMPVVGFLGAGNIANAFIRGFINTKTIPEGNIIIFDNIFSQYEKFNDIKVIKATNLSEFEKADFIFICVKPNNVKTALSMFKETGIDLEEKTFVSVCAGVPVEFIKNCLGFEASVIRTMPSTPMLVGMGAVAIARNPKVKKETFEFVYNFISKIAVTAVLEESQMNPVISVNGSSPAYVYLFIKALLDGAEDNGISKDDALPLILKTVEGTVEMVRRSGKSIEELIKDVASPNGTTLKALEKLYEGNFERTVSDAMTACTGRADEITAELTSE
ncbi:MAG: pyrroline-5-carboxylate reductase [Clostridiales bacterium]|jgi:pyrroline-5-carboxylate reductase|nr:pyrroline-5-carboxylate reductase [Clostridiales bacterium]